MKVLIQIERHQLRDDLKAFGFAVLLHAVEHSSRAPTTAD